MAVFNEESRAALSAPHCHSERGRKGERRISHASCWPRLSAPPAKKQHRESGQSVPASARDSAARPRSFMQSAWWQSLTKNPMRPLAHSPCHSERSRKASEESPTSAVGRAYPRRLPKSDVVKRAGAFPPPPGSVNASVRHRTRPLAPRTVIQSEAARAREESPAPSVGRAYPRRLPKSNIGTRAGASPDRTDRYPTNQ